MKKTSNLMTVGGILAAFGTSLVGLPLIVLQAYAQIVKDGPPHWFNIAILPMMLLGFMLTALGTALLGVAGKGADDHSTEEQIKAASNQAAGAQMVLNADAAAKPESPAKVILEPETKENL